MGNVKNLTDSDFDSTISGAKLPLLIDFSATWCGPCKALAPTIDSVAGDYKGRLEVYKVDIDEAEGASTRFGISSVPTCVFLRDGKEVDRFIGMLDVRSLKQRVERVLGG
ncbi:MAG: thioredoxin [Planctomycetes bacterium]|nr:thioredoxin [Planctomycetota bacterium]